MAKFLRVVREGADFSPYEFSRRVVELMDEQTGRVRTVYISTSPLYREATVAMSQESTRQLHYDEHSDVLYASVGEPQVALSFEIDTQICL